MLRTLTIASLTTGLMLISSASHPALSAKEPAPLKTYEPDQVPQKMQGLPLLFHENFESGKADDWEPTDDKAWKMIHQGDNHVFSLTKKRSKFEPPVRSPYNRALLKNFDVSDFIFDVKLQSTIPDYGHRDLCLFFGYQDDAHFYYVHFGKKMDDHANQIFIVNDKPRTKISTKTTAGTDWDDEWHHARVVRDTKSGSIKIYFDDMDEPVMTATDKTFLTGRVGIGSFDDTGNFDELLLFGKQVK
ncbi:hypothetical protein [Gimesia maris]|uniref:hypothetical protein n=1 Tax=Gimesia maris TaxID=122 RepID=UPI0024201DB3|nr:hypothetical protein [Gimesia maris]|tara:strand:- start:11042 stop:11776 length:735 start_codon:yes stop_codon:yes gene_type:complete